LVERGVKKPGCPPTMVIQELVAFRALRKYITVWCIGPDLAFRDQIPKGVKLRQAPVWRVSGNNAALIAPIETPETQSGRIFASCMAW
jgi:hypothetical protein